MSGLPDEIWDGNGGRMDAKKASLRDLVVALHVKADRLIDDVRDHETRIRSNEGQIAVLAAREDSERQASAAVLAWAAVVVAILCGIAGLIASLIT